MSTPSGKAPIRFSRVRPNMIGRRKSPDGRYSTGIHDASFAALLGQITSYLPQIEERVIKFMAILLGDKDAPAKQVFRALNSEEARIKVMRALLEQAPHNTNRGPEYDEIIRLFAEVKKRRNAYVHGLWYTHESGRVYIAEASADELSFHEKREVPRKEMEAAVHRMNDLWENLSKITGVGRGKKFAPTSPEKPDEPQS